MQRLGYANHLPDLETLTRQCARGDRGRAMHVNCISSILN
jgi:hypothetical protein